MIADARPDGHDDGGRRPTEAASLQRGRRRLKGRRQDHGHDDRHDDRREQQRDLGHDEEQRGDDERSPAPLTQAIEPDRDRTGGRRGSRTSTGAAIGFAAEGRDDDAGRRLSEGEHRQDDDEAAEPTGRETEGQPDHGEDRVQVETAPRR